MTNLDRVREALEYSLHWLEAYYGVSPQDTEAKTHRRLEREALSELLAHEKEDGEREARLHYLSGIEAHDAELQASYDRVCDDRITLRTQLQELLEAAKDVEEYIPRHYGLCSTAVSAGKCDCSMPFLRDRLRQVIKNIEVRRRRNG